MALILDDPVVSTAFRSPSHFSERFWKVLAHVEAAMQRNKMDADEKRTG